MRNAMDENAFCDFLYQKNKKKKLMRCYDLRIANVRLRKCIFCNKCLCPLVLVYIF